jgi:Leucine-rich repeat (LRR) protein
LIKTLINEVKMKKFLLLSAIAVFVLSSCSSGPDFSGFDDKVFIECIKKTEKKFEEITELDCSNNEKSLADNPFGETIIKSIKGVEKLVNLKKFVVKKNKVEDISFLSELKSLTHLDLSGRTG